MTQHLRPALVLLALFSLLCGLAYPLAVTGIAKVTFPGQAGGSLITANGKVLGSTLIGQAFAAAKYFHGRPSAAGSQGYDAVASSGSNLGPSSKALKTRVDAERARLAAENPAQPVPAELLYASASGLDPDISPAAAEFQLARISSGRGLTLKFLHALLEEHIVQRRFGLLGEPTVNVLALNLALDEASARAKPGGP